MKTTHKIIPVTLLFVVFFTVAAFGRSVNIKVNKIGFVKEKETMYSDNLDISGTLAVANSTSGIKIIKPAPVIEIELLEPLAEGTEIKLELTNAAWFFRNVNNATEYYTGGVEKQLPVNYNANRGYYEPEAMDSKNGTYTRFIRHNETAYELKISNYGKTGILTLTETGIRGNKIVVPMVTRALSYKDMSVSVSSAHSGVPSGEYLFGYVAIGVQEQFYDINPMTASVENVASHNSVFDIGNIMIEENLARSIESGAFEIVAPKGVSIIPDIDGLLSEHITRSSLDTTAIDVYTEGGLKWFEGGKGNESVRGKDYQVSYKYTNNKIDPSVLRIELKNMLESNTKDKGTLVISGFKLVADDTVPKGNINLAIRNFNGQPIYEEEFLAGIKIGLDPEVDYEGIALAEFLASKEFRSRTFISLYEDGTIRPLEEITRGEAAKMIYRLLGDLNQEYTLMFDDVSVKYGNAVAFCVEKGYFSGYSDGTFQEDKVITRAELATVINNIIDVGGNAQAGDGLESDHWAYETLLKLADANILSGYEDGSLRPDQPVNRQEAVVMLNKAFDRGFLFDIKIVYVADVPYDSWAYAYIMNAVNGYTK